MDRYNDLKKSSSKSGSYHRRRREREGRERNRDERKEADRDVATSLLPQKETYNKKDKYASIDDRGKEQGSYLFDKGDGKQYYRIDSRTQENQEVPPMKMDKSNDAGKSFSKRDSSHRRKTNSKHHKEPKMEHKRDLSLSSQKDPHNKKPKTDLDPYLFSNDLEVFNILKEVQALTQRRDVVLLPIPSTPPINFPLSPTTPLSSLISAPVHNGDANKSAKVSTKSKEVLSIPRTPSKDLLLSSSTSVSSILPILVNNYNFNNRTKLKINIENSGSRAAPPSTKAPSSMPLKDYNTDKSKKMYVDKEFETTANDTEYLFKPISFASPKDLPISSSTDLSSLLPLLLDSYNFYNHTNFSLQLKNEEPSSPAMDLTSSKSVSPSYNDYNSPKKLYHPNFKTSTKTGELDQNRNEHKRSKHHSKHADNKVVLPKHVLNEKNSGFQNDTADTTKPDSPPPLAYFKSTQLDPSPLATQLLLSPLPLDNYSFNNFTEFSFGQKIESSSQANEQQKLLEHDFNQPDHNDLSLLLSSSDFNENDVFLDFDYDNFLNAAEIEKLLTQISDETSSNTSQEQSLPTQIGYETLNDTQSLPIQINYETSNDTTYSPSFSIDFTPPSNYNNTTSSSSLLTTSSFSSLDPFTSSDNSNAAPLPSPSLTLPLSTSVSSDLTIDDNPTPSFLKPFSPSFYTLSFSDLDLDDNRTKENAVNDFALSSENPNQNDNKLEDHNFMDFDPYAFYEKLDTQAKSPQPSSLFSSPSSSSTSSSSPSFSSLPNHKAGFYINGMHKNLYKQNRFGQVLKYFPYHKDKEDAYRKHCENRIAPWVAKHLLPAFNAGLISNREIFKCLCHVFAEIIIKTNQFPNEKQVESIIGFFLTVKPLLKCLQDIQNGKDIKSLSNYDFF